MKALPELHCNHRMKHNLCSFSTKKAPGNPARMGVLQPLLTNQDGIGGFNC